MECIQFGLVWPSLADSMVLRDPTFFGASLWSWTVWTLYAFSLSSCFKIRWIFRVHMFSSRAIWLLLQHGFCSIRFFTFRTISGVVTVFFGHRTMATYDFPAKYKKITLSRLNSVAYNSWTSLGSCHLLFEIGYNFFCLTM